MTKITRILLIAQVFFLLSNFSTSILQVNQVFLVPALAPVIYNMAIISSIFILAPRFGIYGVVYGVVVGSFLHLIIQVPFLIKTGFRYTLSIQTRLKGVREVIRLMAPRTLSLGLGEVENTIILFFASTLATGSLSLFNLALQIMYLPSRIFGSTIGQASLPILSKNIAENKLDLFRNTVRRTISQSLFIAIPLTVLILVHRLPIIRLAFGAKQFPWTATLITAKALAFLTPAIICQSIIQILVRAFYALHDTKTPLQVSFLSLVFTVTTAFFVTNHTNLGVVGLALSVSVGSIVQCLGLITMFIKKVDGVDWGQTFLQIYKVFISSLAMFVVAWIGLRLFDNHFFDTSKTAELLVLFSVTSSLGLATYFYFAKLLGLKEVDDYQRQLRRIKKLIFG